MLVLPFYLETFFQVEYLSYLGMRKDFILTPEEKQSKKQRLEENRSLRSTDPDNKIIKTETIPKPVTTQHHKLVREIDLI